MSLINEALRKARKEAAERDAEERGVTYRPPRAHLPTERSWLPALAGVALGAVLAAAAFWLLMPQSAPNQIANDVSAAPASAEQQTVTDDAPPTEEPEPQPELQTEPQPKPEPKPETETVAEIPAEPGPAPAIMPPPEPPAAAQDPRPPKQPSAPAVVQTPESTEEPPAESSVDGATYILEATVGGVALRLDFIVWSANPFAQINGSQVSVGQTIEGFLVRDIAREEVTLEGESGSFTLRIR